MRCQARSSVRRTRCANIGMLQDGRRPLGRTTEPAGPPGMNKAFEKPGTAGSVEAAMDPRAVWVNGALGEPEVVGPAGSVWVTRSGKEEPDDRSSPKREKKGRLGTLGHESILELWLNVQTMRVASGCWERSRVELHPHSEGEGPVEKGIPGRASWVETSQGDITGPWVQGNTSAFPQASGLPSAREIGAGCGRVSVFCRQGQTGKTPPAVGEPGIVEKVGCAALGPWEKRQTVRVPEAIGWSEALKRPGAGEMRECASTSGLCGGGQSVQVSGALAEEAVYGHMLWEREQIVGSSDALMVLPRAMEDETTLQEAPGLWQRRQEVEDIGSRSISGLRGIGQPVGVSCARKGGAKCGSDPGSWVAVQAVELSPEEQEAGSQDVQSMWDREQAVGASRFLGKEADNASVPGLWGTEQLLGLQTVVIPGNREEETSYDVSGFWERQQALGAPLAEPLPGPVMEETPSENLLSLWERRQVMREQEAQGPAALTTSGAVDQDASCGGPLCQCGKRQAMGLIETAVMPKHRCATGVPSALGVPVTLWMCQQSSSTDGVSLLERTHAASGRPMASEECSSVAEDAESGSLPGSWGRRPAIGVPMAPEIPGSMEVEAGSRGFSDLSGRRHTVGIAAIEGAAAAGLGMAPRASSSVGEHISSRRESDSVGGRPATGVSMTLGLPLSTGDEIPSESLQRRQSATMPVARIATGSRGILGFAGRGQAVGVSYACELGGSMWGSPRSAGEDTTYENFPRVSARRTTVLAVSKEDLGLGHFRGDLQGNGRRAMEGVPEAGVRENDLVERVDYEAPSSRYVESI